jgi:hypothetical protein
VALENALEILGVANHRQGRFAGGRFAFARTCFMNHHAAYIFNHSLSDSVEPSLEFLSHHLLLFSFLSSTNSRPWRVRQKFKSSGVGNVIVEITAQSFPHPSDRPRLGNLSGEDVVPSIVPTRVHAALIMASSMASFHLHLHFPSCRGGQNRSRLFRSFFAWPTGWAVA